VGITLVVCAVTRHTRFALAADIQWNGSVNSSWDNLDNWDPFGSPFCCIHRVPGDGDTAILANPAGDNVILLGDTAPINGVTIGNGIKLNTNGRLLQVDNAGAATTTVAGPGSRLMAFDPCGAGVGSTTCGPLIEAGPPTALLLSTDRLFLFNGGELAIGGEFLVANAEIGGKVRVDGTTTLLADARLIGTQGGVDFGGDIVVDASSMFLSQVDVTIGNGIDLTARNNAGVSVRTLQKIAGGATYNILSGADVSLRSINIGFGDFPQFGSNGTLNVDGAGTTLTNGFGAAWNVGADSGGGTGLLSVKNLAIVDAGEVTVRNTGWIDVDATAALTFDVLEIRTGGVVTVQSDLDADGLVRLVGGIFHGQDVTVDTGDGVIIEDGIFRATSIALVGSATFDFLGGTLHVGTFDGSLVNQGGTLAPGASAGRTTVSGDYTQQAGATLDIEVAGTTPEMDHDVVEVAGNVFLDGELNLRLIDDYIPAPSDSLTVLSSIFIVGAFDNVLSGQRLDTADGLGSFLVHYGPTSAFNHNQVVLTDFESAGIPGDYNQNGVVDAADYVVWRNNLGAPPGTLPNDIDGGVIGQAQYDTWKANFGNALGSGSLANRAVPEPAAAILTLIATGFATRLRCRRVA
jgi:hypothetical protein